MKLSQERNASLSKSNATKEKEKGVAENKLKASNFVATLLKIGTWEVLQIPAILYYYYYYYYYYLYLSQ